MYSDMHFCMGKIRFEISFLLPIGMAVALILGYLPNYLAIFFMILAHEIGHIVCAKLFGCKIYSLTFLLVGLNAEIDLIGLNRWSRILVNLSGPLVNVILFASGKMLNHFGYNLSNMTDYMNFTNLYLAIFNLLPVWPLDGSKILKDLLFAKTGLFFATRLIKALSVTLAIILILLGMVLIYFNSWNLSLILIGIYIFYYTKNERMESSFLKIRNVLYRRKWLMEKGVYPTNEMVAMQSVSLAELLNKIDSDEYHIIHVLNDEHSIVRTFTEQELIDGMIKYSTSITLRELICYLDNK